MFAVLRQRNFALLWIGQSISFAGDLIFDTTLILWIATRLAKDQAWAPLAVSSILLAASLPALLLRPIAGVFVDRWEKRRTLLWMDGLRAGLIALLLPLAAGVPLPFVFDLQVSPFWQLGAIGGIVVLASACAQFFGPAQFALIGDLVAEPDRARAIGLNQTVTNFALIVGPPLATLLFFTVGVPWALLLDVLSFVASFLTLLAIQAPQSARSLASGNRGNILREFGDGLQFFLSNTVLMSLTIALFVAFLGSGCLNALNIFFLTQNLHTPARLYGFFGTAFGLGGLVGAVFASFFVQRLGMVRLFWLSVVAAGVGLLVYARLTSFAPAVIVLFLIQVVSACIAVAVEPILLRIIPRELIGRVTSLFTPTLGLASMLSTTLAGFLDSTVLRGLHTSLLGITFGPVDTIFTGAGILIILGGFYAKVQLRDFERGS